MTRVSSYGQGQALIAQMLRNQSALAVAQERVSTGKQAQEFKELKSDASVLLGARSAVSRVEAQRAANVELAQKLEVYNATFSGLADVAEQVRQDLIGAVNLNSGTGLMDKVRAAFERAKELTNTRYQGQYILGGGRNDSPPATVGGEAAFIALPSGAAALGNGTQRAVQRIDEQQTLQYGELANEVTGPLYDVLQRIMQFENGTLPAGAAGGPAGSFSSPLSDGQQAFLIGEFDRAVAATATVREAEARNGVRMQTLEQLADRQDEELSYMKGFVSKLEDADPAQAISDLRLGETALEASMQVVARLNRLSLLDFLT